MRGHGDLVNCDHQKENNGIEHKVARREMRGALIGERFGETASHVARAVHSTSFSLSPLISQIKSSDPLNQPLQN